MVSVPVVSTFEVGLPDSMPNRPEDTMATLAGPPRVRPIRAEAKFMKKLLPPVFASTTPNTMKPISVSETTCIGIPMMLSSP